MIDYLPFILREMREYKDLFVIVQNDVINELFAQEEIILDNTIIMKSDEKTVQKWEKFLKIIPEGNLHQRKLYILGVLQTVGKLTEEKVKQIVEVYSSGAESIVTFEGSTIVVKVVKIGSIGEIFLFNDIKRNLEIMKPAHIGLSVLRYYSTWGDIEDNFTSWGDVENSFASWGDVEQYIPPILEY